MANNDNAMARFLFAILQQKCLKDVSHQDGRACVTNGYAKLMFLLQIDWNEVARNPVLTQEITNGHAARMRFSRFRQQILGLAPQKRNRPSTSGKSRVTKRKREDDRPKPKKEDEDESKADSKPIKPERKSISQLLSQLPQPPAPMTATPAMKMKPGLAHPYSQHFRHESTLSAASPSIKKERLTGPGMANTPTPIPEPTPFGIRTTTPTSAASTCSTPYPDNNNHRMQMRLPTPCSDSDGISGIPGFLPHSPGLSTNDLVLHHSHGQHHHHTHAHALVGAGSPPLSTSAPSPYDFSQQQQCCDTTNSGVLADPVTPWHSQHHSQHRTHNSQSQNPVPFSFGLGITTPGPAYSLDRTGYNPHNDSSNPFSIDHLDHSTFHHLHNHQDDNDHHQHHHHNHHNLVDPFHGIGGAGAGVSEASLYRERELELELGATTTPAVAAAAFGMGVQVKGEWEGEVFEI